MTRPTENEVFDLDRFFKNHPEELKAKSQYDKDLEKLEGSIEDLTLKGVITDEKNASQDMANKTQ